MSIFPNVPDVLGVPPIPRDPFGITQTIVLLARDALNALGFFIGPQWGLFQFGIPIVLADSVLEVGYKQNWALATYQIEQGGFETYDKVEQPFESTLRFASGGSDVVRSELLASIAAIAGNLQLYDVVTPEAVYVGVNVNRYDYKRHDGRVGLLTVDVLVTEVRVNSQTQFTNTKTPGGSDAVDTGTVQTSTPTPSQQNIINTNASEGLF